MYTYIFDDKENEVALNNIKAIIFDIVSNEKAKQTILREGIVNSGDAGLQQGFFEVSAQQDDILNSLMFVGSQIGELLKKADSYSRDLREMNNRNYVASVNENVVANGNENTNGASVGVQANQPMIGDLYANSGNDVVQSGGDKENNSDDANVKINNDTVGANESGNGTKEEVIPTKSGDAGTITSDDISEMVYPVIDVTADNGDESSTEEKAESKEDDKPEEEQSSVQLVIPGASSTGADTPSEGPEVSGPLIPTTDSNEEAANSTKLVIPSVSNEETKEEEKTESAETPPVTIVNNPPQIIPDVDSDPMLDALLANDVSKDAGAPKLTFKKRGEDLARAILTSGKQTANLRKSLATQEALLSSRGFFENLVTGVTDSNLEQQLVDNGLLPGDEGQAQIEQMMNQANELYAAGKLDEAQAMYDKISELNKKAQEGVAMAA